MKEALRAQLRASQDILPAQERTTCDIKNDRSALLVLGMFLRTKSTLAADGKRRSVSQAEASQSDGALRIRFSMAMGNSSTIAPNQRTPCRGRRRYSPTRNGLSSGCPVHTMSPAKTGIRGSRLPEYHDRGCLGGVRNIGDRKRVV